MLYMSTLPISEPLCFFNIFQYPFPIIYITVTNRYCHFYNFQPILNRYTTADTINLDFHDLLRPPNRTTSYVCGVWIAKCCMYQIHVGLRWIQRWECSCTIFFICLTINKSGLQRLLNQHSVTLLVWRSCSRLTAVSAAVRRRQTDVIVQVRLSNLISMAWAWSEVCYTANYHYSIIRSVTRCWEIGVHFPAPFKLLFEFCFYIE